MGKQMTTPPLGRNRWTFLHNNAHGDHLVHSVLAVYEPKFEQRDTMIVPVIGISECGIYVKLLQDSAAVAEQGVYIHDEHPLTCMRCASGICTDGISWRQTQKNMLFGTRYGRMSSRSYNMPVQGSAAMIQGQRAHQTVLDEVQNIDYATLEKKLLEAYKDIEPWMASELAKLKP